MQHFGLGGEKQYNSEKGPKRIAPRTAAWKFWENKVAETPEWWRLRLNGRAAALRTKQREFSSATKSLKRLPYLAT